MESITGNFHRLHKVDKELFLGLDQGIVSHHFKKPALASFYQDGADNPGSVLFFLKNILAEHVDQESLFSPGIKMRRCL